MFSSLHVKAHSDVPNRRTPLIYFQNFCATPPLYCCDPLLFFSFFSNAVPSIRKTTEIRQIKNAFSSLSSSLLCVKFSFSSIFSFWHFSFNAKKLPIPYLCWLPHHRFLTFGNCVDPLFIPTTPSYEGHQSMCPVRRRLYLYITYSNITKYPHDSFYLVTVCLWNY